MTLRKNKRRAIAVLATAIATAATAPVVAVAVVADSGPYPSTYTRSPRRRRSYAARRSSPATADASTMATC
ncbi:hypothetical protein ABE488_05065 [Luteimonas sp. TWI662]|uniref:hypothetical protein n=1 Tax=Luteimonas sp. TWI662 TaxID=3136789 RepID=UPI00320A1F43